MCPEGQASVPYSQAAWAYVVSSLTLIVGYCLFVTGIVLPSWRLEIGYIYGLWGFMSAVQGGIILSLLLLSTSMMCLLVELYVKSIHWTTKHILRTGKVVSATAGMGEILAAFTLGYYGYKTVMAVERLPVLTTGFATTGLGIMVSLLGNILRNMGPPATWGHGVCCLAPRRRYKQRLLNLGVGSQYPCAGSYYYSPTVSTSRAAQADTGHQKVGLTSCLHTMNKGNSYSSVPSTASSSLEKGYRHYEEISFEEMPPPPLELLNSHLPVDASENIQQRWALVPQLQQHIGLNTTSHLNKCLSSDSSSLQYLEMKQQQVQHHQHHAPDCPPPGYSKRSGFAPQATPRQTNQQRSIIRSAQRHVTTSTSGSSTLTTQNRSQDTRPTARYQTLLVK